MERRALEGAATTYSHLRGLFLLPLGVVLIFAALANAGVGPFGEAWAFPLAVAVAGAVCLLLNRRYQERYGRIGTSARQQARTAAAVAAAVAVMLGLSSLLDGEAAWSLDLPVNAIAVSFALTMLISYTLGAGLRAHQAAIWTTVLLAGALPVWDGGDPGNAGLAICGAAAIVSGLLDHRLFVGAFGPAGALDGGEDHA